MRDINKLFEIANRAQARAERALNRAAWVKPGKRRPLIKRAERMLDRRDRLQRNAPVEL